MLSVESYLEDNYGYFKTQSPYHFTSLPHIYEIYGSDSTKVDKSKDTLELIFDTELDEIAEEYVQGYVTEDEFKEYFDEMIGTLDNLGWDILHDLLEEYLWKK